MIIFKGTLNYLQSLNKFRLERISKYINHANNWLKLNRPKTKPINLVEVISRLLNPASFLGTEADAKTKKGSKNGYLTGIMYLAPHKIIGLNLCPFAVTCIKDCLFNAGRGRMGDVSRARIIKTLCFALDVKLFERHLIKDIKKIKRQATNKNMVPVIRLNGTSDLYIEKIFAKLFNQFPDLQFYDYTKSPNKFNKTLPSNYDLTFSFDGVNWTSAIDVLNNNGRVAVVFKNGLPESFDGFKVVNGDETDLRFLDETGIIVGLNAKGSAKNDLADDRFIIDQLTDPRCK